MLGELASQFKRLCKPATNWMSRTSMVEMISGREWVLARIAQYMSIELEHISGLGSRVIYNSKDAHKNSLLHFINRYKLLGIDRDTLSRLESRFVFLTWCHGDLTTKEPVMSKSFDQLLQVCHVVNKIIIPCEDTRKALNHVGIKDSQMELIPLGYKRDLFQIPKNNHIKSLMRAKLSIPDKSFCIGSFQKDGNGWGDGDDPKLVKGPDVFIDTIALLSKKISNIHVLLTGPARGYIKKGLECLGVNYTHNNLEDYADLESYYHALDLYLIASRCEGGPQALLEGWATGIPIVSTRMGMCADLINHGQNGLMAESEDVTQLASYCLELKESSDLRQRLISQALEDVKIFDWSCIAKQHYQKVYSKCL